MEITFKHPFGSDLELYRYPKSDTLQAYDAGDSLLLEELKNDENLAQKRILILNDSFGALTLSLQKFQIDSYMDSYVSYKGAKINGVTQDIYNDLEEIKETYDIIVMKLPKSHAFFEDLLCHCTKFLRPEGQLIISAMVKHLTKNIFDLTQKYIGDTHTSLARKKARLIFANYTKEVVNSPYPLKVDVPEMQNAFIHHSNLFSINKLDIGTRFFLEHIPMGTYKTILDLGCANGIIGIKAKQLNPKAKVLFSDDSYMAIKSAKENYQLFFDDKANFFWTNCFEEGEQNSIDLTLCNPPFHQNNIIGDFIAFQMFKDAHRGLKPQGVLRVIGNSHLSYQHKLKRIFCNSEIVKTNSKFMIIDAIKT